MRETKGNEGRLVTVEFGDGPSGIVRQVGRDEVFSGCCFRCRSIKRLARYRREQPDPAFGKGLCGNCLSALLAFLEADGEQGA